MPVTLTINGVPFQYPVVRDKDWGPAATAWATAVTNLLEQFTASSLPLADDGQIRLGNTDTIEWRNNADSDNVSIYVDTDDKLYYQNAANPPIDLTSLANGNVTGPLTSTDEALARFNGATGQTIQNSVVLLSDTGALSGITDLDMSGDLTGLSDLAIAGNLSGVVDLTMSGALSTPTLITTADLTVTDDADLVDLDASGSVIFSGTSGHSVSEEFANEVIEEYARPVGGTVGVRGVAIATSDTGNFQTASGTPVDVTNATVTITTTGRPVFIGLISSGTVGNLRVQESVGTSVGARFFIVRDVTTISTQTIAMVADDGVDKEMEIQHALSSLWHVDPIGAGTYTYKLQAQRDTGDIVEVNEAKLVAYEL